ncbi:hypothetical protein CLV37_1131, partial [Kineococcus rhizosphaerae]
EVLRSITRWPPSTCQPRLSPAWSYTTLVDTTRARCLLTRRGSSLSRCLTSDEDVMARTWSLRPVGCMGYRLASWPGSTQQRPRTVLLQVTARQPAGLSPPLSRSCRAAMTMPPSRRTSAWTPPTSPAGADTALVGCTTPAPSMSSWRAWPAFVVATAEPKPACWSIWPPLSCTATTAIRRSTTCVRPPHWRTGWGRCASADGWRRCVRQREGQSRRSTRKRSNPVMEPEPRISPRSISSTTSSRATQSTTPASTRSVGAPTCCACSNT